ncbi:MAG: hypothetical protein ACN6OP_02745 [Pseudomonadales bacterium]
MFSHPQFQVASQLLIGLMFQGPSRQLGDRVEDVRHALEVSAELIRQWEEDQPRGAKFTPPTPVPHTRTREAVVDRTFIPTEEWRRNRAKKSTSPSVSRHSGPSVH